jgi:hypothetical protein
MQMNSLNALDKATVLPAKAGTPNRLGQLEAEIKQGMKVMFAVEALEDER